MKRHIVQLQRNCIRGDLSYRPIQRQALLHTLSEEKGGDYVDLNNDEGKIINQKGEQIAVYKDVTGKVTAVSAVCTHMGCIVNWNDKDKTWDCPCHGSRFDKAGKVITGPAVKDLPVKELDK